MSVLEAIEPKKVMQYFEEICKIPHGTFDTKRISDYLVAFAKERGLEVFQDQVNNVIIKKDGSVGYEMSDPVIIQGHMDMVCEKTEDSDHDFKTDPLDLYVKDGYIRARNTTLGGDDGIAVAYALALLDSDDIAHPPIEAVFTVDEEVGMGGAGAIDLSVLKGRMLINIDSDVEGTLLAGCAGGFRQNITVPVTREQKSGTKAELHISGLRGGHSGAEIDQQRGNANKLMARLLNHLNLQTDIALETVGGGSKDNVITPAAKAVLLVSAEQIPILQAATAELETDMKQEFGKDEPGLQITLTLTADQELPVFTKDSTNKIIFFLNNTPNGVQGLNRELKGLVDTSLNMGVVETGEDAVKVGFLVRSSLESKKNELKEALTAWSRYLGAAFEIVGEYPAWTYKPDSKLRTIMADTYRNMFGKDPVITTIHAGLECGLFSGKKPDLDCVSFGPEMLDIHSVEERLNIESTQRMWEYLKAVLANCK